MAERRRTMALLLARNVSEAAAASQPEEAS